MLSIILKQNWDKYFVFLFTLGFTIWFSLGK